MDINILIPLIDASNTTECIITNPHRYRMTLKIMIKIRRSTAELNKKINGISAFIHENETNKIEDISNITNIKTVAIILIQSQQEI